MALVTAPYFSLYAVGKFAKFLVTRQAKGYKFITSKLGHYPKRVPQKSIDWREHWARVQYRKQLLKKIPKARVLIGYTSIVDVSWVTLKHILDCIILRSCLSLAWAVGITFTLFGPAGYEVVGIFHTVDRELWSITPAYGKKPSRDKH